MKHLFFGLQTRERYMALAALAVAAFLWSTSAWGRSRDGWAAWQSLENEAAIQVAWLNKQGEIKAAADIAIVKRLIGAGADVKHAATDGTTALERAALAGHTGVVELLENEMRLRAELG